jgi:FkbM family methyltransferase
MRSRSSIEPLAAAYSLARWSKLLRVGWFRRAFVSSYFLYKRLYEDPFLRLIKRNPELFEGGDVLDVGANIGYTACLFAKAVKPTAKVYAFEPDRYTFDLLGETIREKNVAGMIEAMHLAVGANEGFAEVWHNERHSADHRVVTENFRRSIRDPAKISTVPITKIDSFVNARKLSEISFIKVDVQGYEVPVCRGMTGTLERFPNLSICVEYDPETTRKLGFEPQELLDFFRTRRYKLHLLTRAETKLANDDSMIRRLANEQGYVDLLCLR